MPLSDAAVRNAKPSTKLGANTGRPAPYRLADEKGLYLEVQPSGARYWRLKYRFFGKEKRLALGVYPEVGLAAARKARDAARALLSAPEPVDPAANRKAQRDARVAATANSFEVIAREWHRRQKNKWKSDSHARRNLQRLENDVFPYLGQRQVASIKAPDVLAVCRRIEGRGAIESAHRVLSICSQIFRYAVSNSRANSDPCRDLRGALTPTQKTHLAAITDPKQVGPLLRAIAGYAGTPTVRIALRLAPLVFVRPGELRRAEWPEFDLDAASWRIPAARMKMREQHLVPLSTQALAALRELQAVTGSGKYLFPSVRTVDRPMSENTVNAALRSLGYPKEQMTGHGFRSMASTLLNELGWNRDAIERQLAHAERSKVRAAYNFAEHLPERRRMMQAWADYLDQLAAGAPIVALRAA